MLKKILIVLCTVLLSSSAYAQDWFSAGVLTNPAANTILADTGPYNGPGVSICINTIAISSNVAAVVILEHRNGANTANINSQAILIGASQTVFYPRFCATLTEDQQRFRLRLNAGVTGIMQGSIQP